MTLTRALPAFLALSLLTGCDINAFLPKTPDGKGAITNPDPNEGQLQLSEAELKSVNALSGGLFDALDQGTTTAGVVNTLKSVAAFTGGSSSYRVSNTGAKITDPIDWNKVTKTQVDSSHAHSDKLKDRFVGEYGTGPNSWHLIGDFILPDGLTATGTASIVTNGETPTFDKMGDFEAVIRAELDVKATSDNLSQEATALAGSQINMNLYKPKGAIQDYFDGPFTMTKDGVESTGRLEIDLLKETWTITIYHPIEEVLVRDVAIRLTYDASGNSIARVYNATRNNGVLGPDFDRPRAQFTGTSATGSGLNFVPATFTYRSDSGAVATLKRNGN